MTDPYFSVSPVAQSSTSSPSSSSTSTVHHQHHHGNLPAYIQKQRLLHHQQMHQQQQQQQQSHHDGHPHSIQMQDPHHYYGGSGDVRPMDRVEEEDMDSRVQIDLGSLRRKNSASDLPRTPPPLPKLDVFPKRAPDNMLACATVNLLQTMEQINSNYYENRRIAKRVDDAEHNYRVRRGEILNNRYLVLRALGKGSFGIVVLAADYLWRVGMERLPVYSRHPGTPYFRDLPHDPQAPIEFLGYATEGHLLLALAPVGPDGWLYHSLGWSLVRGPRTSSPPQHSGSGGQPSTSSSPSSSSHAFVEGYQNSPGASTPTEMHGDQDEHMEMDEEEEDHGFNLEVPPDLDHPFFLLPDRFPHLSPPQQPPGPPELQQQQPIEGTVEMMSACMCDACAVWYIQRDLNWTAIKIVKSKSSFDRQAQIEVQLLNRIRQLGGTQHFNVALTDSFRVASHQCLVFELLGPNLYTVLQNRKFRGFQLHALAGLASQLLESMAFLHSMRPLPLIHCDLKPENILILNPNPRSQSMSTGVRVADFGSASTLTSRGQMISYVQSRFYRAPEVILGLPYTTQIDMWSIGCILAEMFLSRPLFDGRSEEEQITRYCEFLGLPPQSMIRRSPKRDRFFLFRQTSPTVALASSDSDATTTTVPAGRWTLKPELREKYRSKSPYRYRAGAPQHPLWVKIVKAVDGGSSELRKRPELYWRYRKFENLLLGLLRMDPESRLRPEDALLHSFLSWPTPAPTASGGQASHARTSRMSVSSSEDGRVSHQQESAEPRPASLASGSVSARQRSRTSRSSGSQAGRAVSRSPSRPGHLIQPQLPNPRVHGQENASDYSRNSLPSSWTYHRSESRISGDGREEESEGPAFRPTGMTSSRQPRRRRRVQSGKSSSPHSSAAMQDDEFDPEELNSAGAMDIAEPNLRRTPEQAQETRKQPRSSAQLYPRHGMVTRSRAAHRQPPPSTSGPAAPE